MSDVLSDELSSMTAAIFLATSSSGAFAFDFFVLPFFCLRLAAALLVRFLLSGVFMTVDTADALRERPSLLGGKCAPEKLISSRPRFLGFFFDTVLLSSVAAASKAWLDDFAVSLSDIMFVFFFAALSISARYSAELHEL